MGALAVRALLGLLEVRSLAVELGSRAAALRFLSLWLVLAA